MEKTPVVENTQKTILVVDDDPTVLAFVSGLLAAGNYHVLSATGAYEAARHAKAYPETIHLLLSDFEMPGMNGIELATTICVDRPAMKVLLMSGFDGGMLVLNEGWHFLAKPFIPSQLRAIIRNLLNEGRDFNAQTTPIGMP